MKPHRTIADHVVGCFSPILIMLLVGSLVFFLIEVFYHGKTGESLRWVMFWFVLAIVLVSRIGMEEGPARAAMFGFALAAATAFYLMATNPAFVFAIFLLGLVWWCAHKLTWNCTYVDDDDDASGRGLAETIPDYLRRKRQPKKSILAVTVAEKTAERHARLGLYFFKPPKPQTPGLWVIYFSAAALPLFGLGQMLIAPGDTASRRVAFAYLLAYMLAVLGLFLTTSFLGLRRYLRQRYLRMPRSIALGWMRFGAGMIVAVLALAFLFPRPGTDYTWKSAALIADRQLRRASDYAVKINPHGQGKGRAGNEAGGSQNSSATEAQPPPAQNPEPESTPQPAAAQSAPTQTPAPELPRAPAGGMLNLLRMVVIVSLALLFGWWLLRNWQLIVGSIRAFIEAIKAFFSGLSREALAQKFAFRTPVLPAAPRRPFANYENPFVTGAGKSWPPERVIVYTYEAVQAWAGERGIEFPPQQTPREFCADLAGKFPELNYELGRLNAYYAYAAYGTRLPANYDVEPVRELWRHLAG